MAGKPGFRLKYAGIILFVFVILGVGTFITGKEERKDRDTEQIDLEFGKNYISYILPDHQRMSFHLWAIQEVERADVNISDYVKDVKLNNEEITVLSYEFRNGTVHGGHRLVDLMIELKLESKDLETADEFIITFRNGEEKTYPFGKMKMKYVPETMNGDVVPTDTFTLQYAKPGLEGVIENASGSTIKLNKVYDLGNVIHYEVQEKECMPKSEMVIQASSVSVDEAYDFYTVRPILEYTMNGVRKSAYLPELLYGISESDTDQIERMMK